MSRTFGRRWVFTRLLAAAAGTAVGVRWLRRDGPDAGGVAGGATGGGVDDPPAGAVRGALAGVVPASAVGPLVDGASRAIDEPPEALAGALLAAVPGLLEEPGPALSRRVRHEYRAGHVLAVEGWHLAVSEVRAIALLGHDEVVVGEGGLEPPWA